MKKTALSGLKVGDLFRLSDNEKFPLWVRDTYLRKGKYLIYQYDNVNKFKETDGKRFVFVED